MEYEGGQQWEADGYARHARFVAELGAPVVDLLAPRPGERILDLGCGDGALTETLVAAGCNVTGLDASPELIDAARHRGLDARLLDGHGLRFESKFESEFDAVFSNAALHWMTRPEEVIDGVWRVLKSGGRFVGEFGGLGNVRTIEASLESALEERGVDAKALNPWFYPDEATYRGLLEKRGFDVKDVWLTPRPTPFPGDLIDWLRTFAGAFTNALPESERRPFLDEIRSAVRPALCSEVGQWTVDYVRLRFAAFKPA